MKQLIISIMALVLWAVAPARTPQEVPNVHVQRATEWVSDPDGVLSPAALARANAMLDSLNTAATTEVTAVVVADMSGQDIDSYATELFELWGIGKKDRDNGLLLVISRDDRRAALRTGYGMEGVINDARAGRIIRKDIAPAMKAGDPDAAVLAAISAVGGYIADPEAADYLHSDQTNSADDDEEFVRFYLLFCCFITVGLLVLLFIAWITSSRLTDQQRYKRYSDMNLLFLMAIPLTLGAGVIAWLLLRALRRHVRLHRRNCPNCGTRMRRVDEVHDNDYLTPAQDMEEKLNSVDYDVWLCPKCNETDIIPYVNRQSNFSECPHCGARARTLQANRILRQPTTRYEGQGVRIFRCANCGSIDNVPYSIARVVQPPVIIGGGGGRGFGGGGGFSGGSFGGGLTGGGGASGGW